MVLKIAHRGALKFAPENTIEGFKQALKLKVDIIEFDIHKTKDNRLVVMHDHSVARTTDGIGLIRNLTLKQLRVFHEINGEPIPTAKEVLALCKNKCVCKIDIKDVGMGERIIRLLRREGMIRKVIITSEIPRVLRKIKKLTPSIKIEAGGFKRRIGAEEIIKQVKKIQADIISPHYSITTKKLVDLAHENGLEVHVWTVNNAQTIRRMKELGVDGITSDVTEKI